MGRVLSHYKFFHQRWVLGSVTLINEFLSDLQKCHNKDEVVGDISTFVKSQDHL